MVAPDLSQIVVISERLGHCLLLLWNALSFLLCDELSLLHILVPFSQQLIDTQRPHLLLFQPLLLRLLLGLSHFQSREDLLLYLLGVLPALSQVQLRIFALDVLLFLLFDFLLLYNGVEP